MQYVSFGAFLVSSLHLPSMFICWSWSSMALLAINVNVLYALLKVYTVETMLITLITQHFTARSPTSDDIHKKIGILLWLNLHLALKHRCFETSYDILLSCMFFKYGLVGGLYNSWNYIHNLHLKSCSEIVWAISY